MDINVDLYSKKLKIALMAVSGLLARLAYAYIDFTEDWQANRVKSKAP
jgi:hypothetical protein